LPEKSCPYTTKKARQVGELERILYFVVEILLLAN
jgi:hypothetical protein